MNNISNYIFEKLKINKDVNKSSKLDYNKIYNIISHTIPVKFDLEIDDLNKTITLKFFTDYVQKIKKDYNKWIINNLEKNNINILSSDFNIDRKIILKFNI